MNDWQKIRVRARQLRSEVCKQSNLRADELHNAADLIERCFEVLELLPAPENPQSKNLNDSLAVFNHDFNVIHFNNQLPDWFKFFCIAHEIGHFCLHEKSVHCSAADIESYADTADLPSAIREVVGYGAGERREREANRFALELLLPSDILRTYYVEKKSNAAAIAKTVGLPKTLVLQQLARAVLLPQTEEKPENEKTNFDLDDSQRKAAQAENCPLLITAGPGTGKTQTLIRRILSLLENGVAPERILALTFSNKATEEMRERITTDAPEAAATIPIMTFHSFGLEILRKFWAEAGLNSDSNLIERLDAISYLEANLNELNLVHFQSLSEPTRWLAPVLSAISRAKDELVSPEQYLKLSEKMRGAAESEKEITKAGKCLEVARIYRFYQDYLEREKLLDFGELIFRAVRLLRENPTAKDYYANQFDAILVDEFQDVNRASGVLLKEIAGDGRGLWAVGDLRQSIYRWRGASPANLKLFGEDFPDASMLSLETNYRSGQAIINLFGHFAGQMKAGGTEVFSDWQATETNRDGAKIHYEICEDLETEANCLAENVLRYKAAGVSFKDQAVICRSHAQLNRFAEKLAEKNVPILYLGNFFEREEIRDLLALLDLKSSPNGFSLMRVAQFSEYAIPLADVQKIIHEANSEDANFQTITANENILKILSDAGKVGFAKLKSHLDALAADVSAWQFISEYLFETSGYLRKFLENENAQSKQNLLAIYQLLALAQAQEKRFAAKPIQAFLTHVRRLARFGEDRSFAQVPASAENTEAVRLLTVHAAKGLEFETVFLPFLGKGHFPSRRQGEKIPAPKDLTALDADYHIEEEECLFFVGASRAKNNLHLSRSAMYNDKVSNKSTFLEMLGTVLPAAAEVWAKGEKEIEKIETVEFSKTHFHHAQIKRYTTCPRQFYYRDVLKLDGKSDDGIYLKFHRAVYQTLGDLQKMRNAKEILNESIALEKLDEIWRESNLDEHAYGSIYRRSAEEMLKRLCRRIGETNGEISQKNLSLRLANGTIFIAPDHLEFSENAVSIRRYRTRQSPALAEGKREDIEDAEAILHLAVQREFPDAEINLQKIYLADDVEREVVISQKVLQNRTEKFEKTLAAIQRKEFAANPNAENCPNCAYFFICPK